MTGSPPDDFDLVFDAGRIFVSRRYRPHRLTRIDLHLSDGRRIQLPAPEYLASELSRLDAPTAAPTPPPTPNRHSPDFRSVTWGGRDYHLTRKQAVIVSVLWEGWEAGTPDVGQEVLLRTADSECTRLVDLFRRSSAWGELIVAGETAGTYRLA